MPTDERKLQRAWFRVRRWARKDGVRPLRLHCARHTVARLALASGKSIVWDSGQLGHSDSSITPRVYSHMMLSEEGDLSFADFGVSAASHSVAIRLLACEGITHPRVRRTTVL